MFVERFERFCFIVSMVSIGAWLILSVALIWIAQGLWEDNHLWKLWLTSQVVFVSSALVLRLCRLYRGRGPTD